MYRYQSISMDVRTALHTTAQRTVLSGGGFLRHTVRTKGHESAIAIAGAWQLRERKAIWLRGKASLEPAGLRAPTGVVIPACEDLGFFLALAALGAICWFFAGWRLRGWRLLLWDLVLPLLAVAAVCVIGPGYLFPKEPYEGPRLITFSPAHSLTLLDLPGFACTALAALLACGLLLTRRRGRGRQRHIRRVA